MSLLDVGDDRVIIFPDAIAIEDSSEELALKDAAALLGKSPQRALALKVLPLLREGLERQELANRLGETKASVTRACAFLRGEIRRKQECSC